MTKKEKKKTTVQIGYENQSKYEKIMNKEGFITDGRPIASRFTKNKDYYNQFDLVGMKLDEICWVQCKTDRATGVLEEIIEWIKANKNYLPTIVTFRLAVLKHATKKKPERWIVTKLDRNGNVLISRKQDDGKNCRKCHEKHVMSSRVVLGKVRTFFDDHPIHSFTIRKISDYLEVDDIYVAGAIFILLDEGYVRSDFSNGFHMFKRNLKDKV